MMRICCLFFVLAMMSGCAPTSGIALQGGESGGSSLQVDNNGMAHRLTLSLQQQVRREERLQLAVRLKSNIAYDQTLQYRVDWFDMAGMPVEPDSGHWQPLVLHGGEQKVIQAVALLPSATSFRFSVRDVVKD
ncbi:MAG: YcfL family protein [Aeromonadaceae bacterium]